MFEDYQEKLKSLEQDFPKYALDNIHHKSLTNFMIYYPSLKQEDVRVEVKNLIEEYFNAISKEDYLIDTDTSRALYSKYIMRIARYYHYQLNFQYTMQIRGAVFVGIIIDLILLVTGLLSKIHFIPIATISMICYNNYLYLLYGKKNKLYGLKY